jgi:hypothetical protein
MLQKLDKKTQPGLISITIDLELGVMIDQQTWIPQEKFLPNQFDFDRISVTAVLDNTVWAVTPGTEKLIQFTDSAELTYHELSLTVSGFDDHCHQFVAQLGDCAVMVWLKDVRIENLGVMQLVQEQAKGTDCNHQTFVPSEYQGINGTWRLEFYCPIYQWLLENHKHQHFYS